MTYPYKRNDGAVNALVREAGITYRQFDSWCRAGYVPGMGGYGPGSGGVRELTRAQEQHVLVMARIVNAGVAPSAATRLASALRRDGKVDLGAGLVLLDQAPVA